MEIRDLFSTFDISASALDTYNTQLSITAENIANAQTTRTNEGTPYRRKILVKKAQHDKSTFVSLLNESRIKLRKLNPHHIAASSYQNTRVQGSDNGNLESEILEKSQFKKVYEPSHPDADLEGFVEYPDVNVVWEMMELITASRAYEANITVMNAVKNIAKRSLEI